MRDLGFGPGTFAGVVNRPVPPSIWPLFLPRPVFGTCHFARTAGRFARIFRQVRHSFPKFLDGLTPISPPYLCVSDTPFVELFFLLRIWPLSL